MAMGVTPMRVVPTHLLTPTEIAPIAVVPNLVPCPWGPTMAMSLATLPIDLVPIGVVPILVMPIVGVPIVEVPIAVALSPILGLTPRHGMPMLALHPREVVSGAP